MMKKTLTVLEALFHGLEVKMEGRELVYSREHQGIYMKGERFTNGQPVKEGTGEPILIHADFPLDYFIQKCEEMPDHDILGLCGSLALTKRVHKKRKDVGDE